MLRNKKTKDTSSAPQTALSPNTRSLVVLDFLAILAPHNHDTMPMRTHSAVLERRENKPLMVLCSPTFADIPAVSTCPSLPP
jgi:hypothetical protein